MLLLMFASLIPLPVRSDAMNSQQPLPARVGAAQDLLRHVVVHKRIEPLGDEPPAIRRLLHPPDPVRRLVGSAAMPGLVVPHDRGAGPAQRAPRAASLVGQVLRVRL